ncbi:MAG TPA: DHHA1 domain-containing protein, partial [Gemmataceae bacterium]|nr:DHHA1 domain-containing protein [Gemmataceae bacterium]
HGMNRLRKSSCIGLRALLETAKLHEKAQLRASDVSYFLAPRINAAGRLGCARLVIELLTSASVQRVTELARYLDDQNLKRQRIERAIYSEACRAVEEEALEDSPVLVLASPEWHAGVIGIVAGRLVERYGRPVLLIAVNGDGTIGHGSGRSVPGFALHEALRACGDGLLSHGGHAAAAGFKIPYTLIEAFRERFRDYAARHLTGAPRGRTLTIDAELPLATLTVGLLEAVAKLEPYGAGNPRPIFVAGPVQVVGEPRLVGKGERHVQFRVCQEATTMKAIAFNMAERVHELLSGGGTCCLAFTPSINEWRGWRSVQLEVCDFQPGPQARFD